MIEFMIIGLPRSGTTWASNWLTTDKRICIHDPLMTVHYSDLDSMRFGKKSVGVACTGLFNFPDFLNKHPAKKVILHRSLTEVNHSLAAIGLPPCTPENLRTLNNLEGEHYEYLDLFCQHTAAAMYRHLTGQAMDLDRHAELVRIEMQPQFAGLKVGKEVTRRLVEEMAAALQ